MVKCIWNNLLFGVVCHFTQLLNICGTQFFWWEAIALVIATLAHLWTPFYLQYASISTFSKSNRQLGETILSCPTLDLSKNLTVWFLQVMGQMGLAPLIWPKYEGVFRNICEDTQVALMCAFNIRIQLGLKCVFISYIHCSRHKREIPFL